MKIKVICLIILFSQVQINVVAQTFSLSPKSPFPGILRSGAASFVLNGIGYVGAGSTIPGNALYSDDFWKYDSSNDTWAQVASLPYQTSYACSFEINNKGHVIGGYKGINLIGNDHYQYDPLTNFWINKSAYPLTSGIFLGIAVAYNGLAYVGSGRSGVTSTDSFSCYDPTTDSWTQKANIPVITESAFAFESNNNIYFGGGIEPTGNLFFQYNPVLDLWSSKNNLLFVDSNGLGQPVFMDAVPFKISAGIFLYGGKFIGVGPQFKIHKYDPLGDSWSMVYIHTANQPPYYSSDLLAASVFVINDIPFATQGNGSSNLYFPELLQLNITTSINDLNNKKNLEIIPSIIEDFLQIEIPSVNQKFVLDFYSSDGKLQMKINLFSGKYYLNLSELPDGYYLYKIVSSTRVLSQGKTLKF